MKVRSNALVETHDGNRTENGFCCMKLIAFLTEDKVTEWDEWHRNHQQASRGVCKYKTRCPIYRGSKIKIATKQL